ncbi:MULTISPECIES: hypothetical protein [unclassified Candidatus Cardinium]|uniref:hypothetical protein n=1 Tax=unclassified Candidatus Cardinium TaxID=2641185 RepID=UPI001FB4C62E|nr:MULTISPECIES: hypothetical protein [unclassified Candidatus Cardinium]
MLSFIALKKELSLFTSFKQAALLVNCKGDAERTYLLGETIVLFVHSPPIL